MLCLVYHVTSIVHTVAWGDHNNQITFMDFYAFPFFSENDAPCREMFILNLKRVSVLTVSTHFKAQPFYLESGALKMEKKVGGTYTT